MSMSTFSLFYFGIEITRANNKIDFAEGVDVYTATLRYGTYTMTEFAEEIERAMNAAGADYTYSCSVNRTTRILTITKQSIPSIATWYFLFGTGDNAFLSPASLMGFTAADTAAATSQAGSSGMGSRYEPQFKLQDYVGPDFQKELVNAVVNESSTGVFEVVSFGTKRMISLNSKWITDRTNDGTLIKNISGSVATAQAFMAYLMKKGKVEFMPDISDVDTYYDLICEKMAGSQAGTGYLLKEHTGKNLPGWYETGVLTFRVIE